jgi:hypothetical protein
VPRKVGGRERMKPLAHPPAAPGLLLPGTHGLNVAPDRRMLHDYGNRKGPPSRSGPVALSGSAIRSVIAPRRIRQRSPL